MSRSSGFAGLSSNGFTQVGDAGSVMFYDMLKPQWESRAVSGIGHVEIQEWLMRIQRENDLSNPTVYRLRQIMGLIYAHGQWRNLIPDELNPLRKVKVSSISSYEAKVIEAQDAYRIWCHLPAPANVLVLLLTFTGLRISEALALRWSDINIQGELIHVRRSWTLHHEGDTKSRASKAAVPCSPILGQFLKDWRGATLYAKRWGLRFCLI